MDTVLNTNRASLTLQKKKISVVVASSEKAPQRKLNQSFINYGLMIFFIIFSVPPSGNEQIAWYKSPVYFITGL